MNPQFTLGTEHRPGLTFDRVRVSKVFDTPMEGATVLGCWNHHRDPAVVWVTNGVPQPCQTPEELPGMQANVFVSAPSPGMTHEQTIAHFQPALAQLYRDALSTFVSDARDGIHVASGAAQLALAYLASKAELSPRESEFRNLLEQAPLLSTLYWSDHPYPNRSLREICETATELFLVEYHVDRKHIEKAREKRAECLHSSAPLVRLLTAYSLPFGDDEALVDKALGFRRIVSSPLRKRAVVTDFGALSWKGRQAIFPTSRKGQPLILDFQARLVIGPQAEPGPSVRIPFSDLQVVSIDEDQRQGDAKDITTYYLRLSDGAVDLIYKRTNIFPYAVYPGMAKRMEEDERQVEIVHAIPAALEILPRLANRKLVGPRTLRELA